MEEDAPLALEEVIHMEVTLEEEEAAELDLTQEKDFKVEMEEDIQVVTTEVVEMVSCHSTNSSTTWSTTVKVAETKAMEVDLVGAILDPMEHLLAATVAKEVDFLEILTVPLLEVVKEAGSAVDHLMGPL